MGEKPFIKFYPSDFLAGTSGLSPAERGVYVTILCLIYEVDGAIQRDDARLSRRCGMPKAAFMRTIGALIDEGKLTEKGGMLSNSRAEKAIIGRQIRVQNATHAANSRHNAHKQKTEQNQRQKDAGAMPGQFVSDASQNQNQKLDIYTPLTPVEGGKSEASNVKKILIEWASEDAVSSFMAYRRKTKGKALTVTAAKRLATNLKEIFNAGGNTDDALGLAEERGWQSVKPEWYFNSQQRDRGGKRSGTVDAFAALSQRLSAGGSGIS